MSALGPPGAARGEDLDYEISLGRDYDEAFYLADLAEAHDPMSTEWHGWMGTPAVVLELRPEDEERAA